jgi:hypothetical protein
VKAENDPRDAMAGQARANFSQTLAERPRERHSNRPAMLHALKITTDRPPVLDRELFEPLPYRFVAGAGAEKDKRNSVNHALLASYAIHVS